MLKHAILPDRRTGAAGTGWGSPPYAFAGAKIAGKRAAARGGAHGASTRFPGDLDTFLAAGDVEDVSRVPARGGAAPSARRAAHDVRRSARQTALGGRSATDRVSGIRSGAHAGRATRRSPRRIFEMPGDVEPVRWSASGAARCATLSP
ncbi:hypothetical protein WS69_19025 [Burkholderia sp. BDU5]|nr:hypothetical protein WS69_19025 [Burkholderia sp. BDU5]